MLAFTVSVPELLSKTAPLLLSEAKPATATLSAENEAVPTFWMVAIPPLPVVVTARPTKGELLLSVLVPVIAP